jgi:hypothetical protein
MEVVTVDPRLGIKTIPRKHQDMSGSHQRFGL